MSTTTTTEASNIYRIAPDDSKVIVQTSGPKLSFIYPKDGSDNDKSDWHEFERYVYHIVHRNINISHIKTNTGVGLKLHYI